jgi:hypothetical protein
MYLYTYMYEFMRIDHTHLAIIRVFRRLVYYTRRVCTCKHICQSICVQSIQILPLYIYIHNRERVKWWWEECYEDEDQDQEKVPPPHNP